MRTLAAVWTLLTFTACGPTSSTVPPSTPPTAPTTPRTENRGPSCAGTLDDYCQRTGGACPTFEAALEEKTRLCSGAGSWSVAVDRCPGAYRSVVWREPVLGGGEEYFSPEGRLVAAYLYADFFAYCGRTSFSQTFGERPRCPSERVSEPVCQAMLQ